MVWESKLQRLACIQGAGVHKYPAKRLARTWCMQKPECIFAFSAISQAWDEKTSFIFWTHIVFDPEPYFCDEHKFVFARERWVWNPLCQLAEPCKADLITFLYCVHPSQNPCQNVSKMFSHNVPECQDVCTAANDQGRKEGMFGENIWSMSLWWQFMLDTACSKERCPFSKLR